MSKEKNFKDYVEEPRKYFEYYEDFKDKIAKMGKALKDAETVDPDEIAQSLLEIVKGTLKDSAVSFNDKKNILEGFVEIISENTKKQNDLPESDKIEGQSEVFDKFAEKLEESIQNDETPTKIFQKYVEPLQEIVTAIKPQELTQDIFCLSEKEKTPPELSKSFLDVDESAFSAADQAIDPITQAIREEILTKQRKIIAEALVTNNIVKPEELDDLNKFRAYFENEQNKETISELLKGDNKLKNKLEQAEISGYKSVHTHFAGRFSAMEWQDGATQNASGIKQQIVRDADGQEIATLSEATHKINPPHTVQKSDGTSVTINNYRTIDFPIKLENNGPMHLSLAVKDQNGRNIAASNAVYFTAHYDDDGKIVEVSSPHPVKFTGDSPDAVGYIEHGGKIYTLPVTQEKYKAMMQEVAKNLGQGVDISPSIESIEAPDLTVTSRGANPEVGYIKPGEQVSVTQENKVMMQENLEHSVEIPPSIDVPSSMNLETSIPNIGETQPHKVQETTLSSTDMINSEKMESNLDNIPVHSPIYEEVKVTIEEKTTEQSYEPKVSQAVLINRAEDIKASLLRTQHISPPIRKTDTEIAEMVRDTSKSLEGKGFKEQEKHVRTTLERLSTPQEKIKLLEGVLKTTADQRWEKLEKLDENQREDLYADPIRLLTENKGSGKEGGIVQPQQKAEYANIKDDVKLQKLLRDEINKINEGLKKPIIAHKTRGAGGHSF
ncbi:Sca4 family protein [Candidatus Tisiphia endosymbiont of Hybos culiciformis]|uniref:Sca4 family protein n=1 Tax=Candidatus Tisiphia endosymbiont of Hybos culiciformis TaxID=3139331 RepID=UPI003CCA8F49